MLLTNKHSKLFCSFSRKFEFFIIQVVVVRIDSDYQDRVFVDRIYATVFVAFIFALIQEFKYL